MYMLESAISVLIMITTLALVMRQPINRGELDIANYKLSVYNSLIVSESIGELRSNVYNLNPDAIENDIESYSQSSLDYDIVIYDENGALTEEPSLVSDNVITVSYFLSGKVGNYEPRKIKVFISGFE